VHFGLIDRGLEADHKHRQVGNDASERIMAQLGVWAKQEMIDPTCDRPVQVHAITKCTT
jgi:hypothetical protein